MGELAQRRSQPPTDHQPQQQRQSDGERSREEQGLAHAVEERLPLDIQRHLGRLHIQQRADALVALHQCNALRQHRVGEAPPGELPGAVIQHATAGVGQGQTGAGPAAHAQPAALPHPHAGPIPAPCPAPLLFQNSASAASTPVQPPFAA